MKRKSFNACKPWRFTNWLCPATMNPVKFFTLFALCYAQAGCLASIPPVCISNEVKPGESEVIKFVWSELDEYFDDGKSSLPPIVEWVNDVSFPCVSASGYCYGEYFPVRHLARVAWYPGNKSFASTSLVHELCHARIDDPGHDTCRNDLPPVSSINERLRKMGK